MCVNGIYPSKWGFGHDRINHGNVMPYTVWWWGLQESNFYTEEKSQADDYDRLADNTVHATWYWSFVFKYALTCDCRFIRAPVCVIVYRQTDACIVNRWLQLKISYLKPAFVTFCLVWCFRLQEIITDGREESGRVPRSLDCELTYDLGAYFVRISIKSLYS